MIKNIVFDMGGVLVDVHREEAVRQFRAIGVADADRLIDSSHHSGIFLDIESGAIDAETFCRLLCEHAGKNIPREAIEHAWKSIISKPPAYKLDYLLELRKQYKLYLLSNNNPILIDWARTSDFSPAGHPVTFYFDKLYISYEMKCVKPDRAIFEAMIRDSGILPSESLFIEDGLHNIRTAKEVGFRTYLAQNGEDWRKPVEEILQRNC
ncbi:MAG: HAD family phosphatase [Tannerella sp.]|jgi:putative hydrolase of the HAD superfamily|nr:HAD family phosphatase [Tannerella sp.]